MPSIDLEIGGRYLTVGGKPVKIMDQRGSREYPYRGDNEIAYRRNGTCSHLDVHQDDIHHRHDGAEMPLGVFVDSSKPKTEVVSPGIDQIPFEGIEAIGAIFAEGEPKYGRDNWKKGAGDIEYERERTRHAMRHLWLWANGDRSEDHIAKVGWFCVTQIWRERNRNGT